MQRRDFARAAVLLPFASALEEEYLSPAWRAGIRAKLDGREG